MTTQISETGYSADFQPQLEELLSFATSKATEEYIKYMAMATRKLYAYREGDTIAGCIGIEIQADNSCVIKHIAVSPENRGQRIGSEMISVLWKKYKFSLIFAETDQDAVGFYQHNGFEITSLGEKYPGRERFLCRKETHKAQ